MKHIHYFGGLGSWMGYCTSRWEGDEDHFFPSDHPYSPGAKNDAAYRRVYMCRCGKKRVKVNLHPPLYVWGY